MVSVLWATRSLVGDFRLSFFSLGWGDDGVCIWATVRSLGDDSAGLRKFLKLLVLREGLCTVS